MAYICLLQKGKISSFSILLIVYHDLYVYISCVCIQYYFGQSVTKASVLLIVLQRNTCNDSHIHFRRDTGKIVFPFPNRVFGCGTSKILVHPISATYSVSKAIIREDCEPSG